MKVQSTIAFSVQPDVPTLNMRVYPKDVLMKSLDEYLSKSQIGFIDIGGGLEECFKIESIRSDGSAIVGDIILLDTDGGNIVNYPRLKPRAS